tara:strand:+ start:1866 stop:2024 length:159 start_codon:yes stop_codon:yes gene_type:complete
MRRSDVEAGKQTVAVAFAKDVVDACALEVDTGEDGSFMPLHIKRHKMDVFHM